MPIKCLYKKVIAIKKTYFFENFIKTVPAFSNITSVDVDEKNFKDVYNYIPITSKRSMREHFLDYISNKFLPKINNDILEEIYNVKNMSKNHDKKIYIDDIPYVIEYTTGSTGIPFPIIKSNNTRFMQGKYLSKCRRSIYGSNFNKTGFLFLHSSNEIIQNIDLFKFNKEDLLLIYNEIKKANTEWLFGTPLIFKKISTIVQEEINNIKFLEYTSQPIIDDINEIKTCFSHAQFVCNYGTREFWNIGWGNEEEGLAINKDYLIVDLIDDQGKVIEEPGIEGDIIITDMSNCTQAFVKYSIGDKGKYLLDSNGNLRLKLIDASEKNVIADTNINGNMIFRRVMRGLYFHDYIKDISRVLVVQKRKYQFLIFVDGIGNKHDYFERRFKYRTGLVLSEANKYEFVFIYTKDFINIKNYKEYVFINATGEVKDEY